MTTPTADPAPGQAPASANPASRAARGRWFSSESLQGLILAVALITLELLPLYLWLLLAAGWATGSIDDVPLPFAFLAPTAVVFALLGRVLRGRPLTQTVGFAVPLGVLALLLAARVSPAAYGPMPGGALDFDWLSALANDLAAVSSKVEVLVLLGALVIAVGWRAVALGHALPDFDDVLDRFKISTAVVVVGAVASVTLSSFARSQLAGDFTLFLPLTIFSGLLAAALSRTALHRDELRGTDPRAAGGERWLAMAVLLSGLVVVAALIIGSIITFGSVSAALSQSGPVGSALNAALNWLANGITSLFSLVFSALYGAWKHLFPSLGSGVRTIEPSPAPAGNPNAPSQIGHFEVTIITLVALVILLLIGLIWLKRLFVLRRDPTPEAIDEQRESLDGSSLLLRQLRDLFARRGRLPKPAAEEALPAGSIRALYREILRTAARRQVGRAASETPDEYGARLARSVGGTMQPDDIGALSEAYDAARYGEREGDRSARHELQERAKRVLQALRRVGQ